MDFINETKHLDFYLQPQKASSKFTEVDSK